jgi:hypothetical protein
MARLFNVLFPGFRQHLAHKIDAPPLSVTNRHNTEL